MSKSKLCPNCGADLNEDQNFCPKCGTKVEAEVKEETVTKESELETSSKKPARSVQQPQPVQQTQQFQQVQINKNPSSGLSIAGFVISLISLFICCGSISIVSLILSIVGLINENKNNGSGKGLAIAGIVISAITILMVLIVIFMFIIIGSSANNVISNAQSFNSI